MTDNGLIDLANAFRKYIPGILTGGNKNGFTEAEKEELKKNLAKADEIAAGKTPAGYANDIGTIFGLDLNQQGNQMILAGVGILVLFALFKD
jgi:hypothetical protein